MSSLSGQALSLSLTLAWLCHPTAATPSGSPRTDGSQARFPISKLKLDNLFLQWLSMADSQSLVTFGFASSLAVLHQNALIVCNILSVQVLSLLEDAKAGRQLARPAESASPLSPSAAQNLFAATTVSHWACCCRVCCMVLTVVVQISVLLSLYVDSAASLTSESEVT